MSLKGTAGPKRSQPHFEYWHISNLGYATLLTLTATTPIWGKLADLFSKKALVQIALLVIGARLIQGVGVGGLSALVQIVIATLPGWAGDGPSSSASTRER